MARAAITAGQAAGDAFAFTRWAWRDAWAVQLLFAGALAATFVGMRGRLAPAQAADTFIIGLAAAALLSVALAAALLRLRVGGSALRGLGPGGLQFGMAELRLLVLGAAAAGAGLLAGLPVVAISAAVFVAFRGLGMVDLPLVGGIQISFLVAAAVWLAAVLAYFYLAARASMAAPATVGKRRLVLRQAWDLSRGQAGAVMGGLLITAVPLVLIIAATVVLNGLATHDPSWGAMSTWPLPDAILAGAVLGAVVAFLQAPLSLGVIGAVYCAQRMRRIEKTQVPHRVHTLLRVPPLDAVRRAEGFSA